MKQMKALVLGASLLTLAACNQQANQQQERAAGAATAPTQVALADVESSEPPSPEEVLQAIYELESKDGKSATSEAGAIATFWLGHAFELGGLSYFTGFTTLTAEPGEVAESSNSMESGHVAIGQATFQRDVDNGAWSNIATDGYVGEFGKLNNAETIDESRELVSNATPDGRLVLAVPVRDFDQGVAYSNYAVLIFNPDGVEGQPFRMWTYAGTIQAGSDNEASCEGGVLTCAKSEGKLTFEADPNGKLPRLRIELSGDEVSGPGEVRALDPGDAIILTYDVSAERYVE